MGSITAHAERYGPCSFPYCSLFVHFAGVMRLSGQFAGVLGVKIATRLGLKSYFLQVGAAPRIGPPRHSPSPAPLRMRIVIISIAIWPDAPRNVSTAHIM